MGYIDFGELAKTKTDIELCDIIADCLKENDNYFADYEEMIAQMWDMTLDEYKGWVRFSTRVQNINENFISSRI